MAPLCAPCDFSAVCSLLSIEMFRINVRACHRLLIRAMELASRIIFRDFLAGRHSLRYRARPKNPSITWKDVKGGSRSVLGRVSRLSLRDLSPCGDSEDWTYCGGWTATWSASPCAWASRMLASREIPWRRVCMRARVSSKCGGRQHFS